MRCILVLGMDNSEYLAIRFHFGGEFILSPRNLQYVRGSVAMWTKVELQ
jgi:hypothetical protein